jgi:hypothetical protein
MEVYREALAVDKDNADAMRASVALSGCRAS